MTLSYLHLLNRLTRKLKLLTRLNWTYVRYLCVHSDETISLAGKTYLKLPYMNPTYAVLTVVLKSTPAAVGGIRVCIALAQR